MASVPVVDRPREKLARVGAEALGDNELVALLLGSGTRSRGALLVAHDVIEAADGGSFAASLRRRVLSPLGLAATFSPIEERSSGEPATGYQAGGSKTAIDLFPAGEGPG